MKYDNNIPIYIQLINQLKLNIISGRFKQGQRLPSVRELALEMKVNPNTMQKALTQLEELKLIYTERTNGKYVTEDIKLINKLKEQYAKELSKEYFICMKNIGFTHEEIIDYLKEMEEKNEIIRNN